VTGGVAEEREQPARPIDLPASLAPLVQGYEWFRNTVGEAGAAVYRLHKAGAPALYLKHGRGAVAGDLIDEMVRLRWLASHIPVPEVRHFLAARDESWLLMTALPGKTAYQLLAEPHGAPAVIDAVAGFLRRLHAIPAEHCPFNADHRLRLAQARDRIDAGLVDTDDFDAARAGWTAEQVWDEMLLLLPLSPDPVVTHGDFSLDNILIEQGRIAGLIDVGRAGVADRYQDLAILCNCLDEFDEGLGPRFFAAYGIPAPDERKLRFHLALDECF
jgi:aminoglycoside 3'-phosphotransferase-1